MKTDRAFAAIALAAALSSQAGAQTTANQTVAFKIEPINAITVSGSPTLIANPGQATPVIRPGSVATSNAQTWSVTTTESNISVTARIDAPMPNGVELKAGLAAPSGATSAGYQTLSTTPVVLVSGLSKQNAAALALSYQLDATNAPNVAAAGSRTVTFEMKVSK